MIQRIQSLFLFLVDIVLVVLLFVPFMTTTIEGSPMGEGNMVVGTTLLDQPMTIVGQVVLCVLAAGALAMFRKRKLQMALCIVGMLLSVIYTSVLASAPSFLNEAGFNIGINKIGPGTWISLANFFLFFLAWWFIRKDERLVQSSDRLR